MRIDHTCLRLDRFLRHVIPIERNLDDSIESSYLESIRFVYNKTIILYNYKLHSYMCKIYTFIDGYLAVRSN